MLREPQPRKVRARKRVEQPEITDTLIVVQVLFTCWSKELRGGAAVAKRSHLPEAALLSLPQQPITQPSFVVQTVREFLNWAPVYERLPEECTQVYSIVEPFHCDSISAYVSENLLHVDFERNSKSGMPRRHPHPDVLTLEKGQWGSVHYNQRQSAYHTPAGWDTAMWWYENWVFNIGYFATVEPRVFLDTQPHQRYTNMSKLW